MLTIVCAGTQANAAAAGGGAKKKGLTMMKTSADKAPAARKAGPAPVKTPKKRVANTAAQDGAAKVKRAMSAYIFFCANKRDSLKGARTVICSTMTHALCTTFSRSAAHARACMQMSVERVACASCRACRALLLAGSRYILFICAAEDPGLGPTDLTKRLGELWKALPADEKAPFEVCRRTVACMHCISESPKLHPRQLGHAELLHACQRCVLSCHVC